MTMIGIEGPDYRSPVPGGGPGASTEGNPVSAAPYGPSSAGDGWADLRFSRLLAVLGVAIFVLAGVLLSLPFLMGGPPLVYIIAYGTALLFGPVGLSLMAAAWRIRNRALYGTEMPPWQRRRLRILGLVLVIVGLFLAVSGFGAEGPVTWVLNLVWGLSLTAYGIRYLVRSFTSDHS